MVKHSRRDQQGYVLSQLQGGVWHSTHPDRFKRIMTCGQILPEPPINDEERWGTRNGPQNYPYVRCLGGVSLFDFTEFDPRSYDERYPLSTWTTFVPFRLEWGAQVWISIDPDKVKDGFLDGKSLLKRWKDEGAFGHRIMPEIEAAVIGNVPSSAFVEAFLSSVDEIWKKIPLEP